MGTMMTMAPAAPAARLMRLARPSLQAFSSSSKAAQRQPSLARGLSLLSRSSSRSSSASPRAAAASVLRPCKPQTRGLANDVKSKIDGAIKEKPVVLFMKGTPRIPQCGFSRAVCQILEVQGVPMDQVKTYNVLEDQELRDAIKEYRCVETLSEECGSCVGYDPAPWLPTRTTSPSASRTPSHEHLEKNTNG